MRNSGVRTKVVIIISSGGCSLLTGTGGGVVVANAHIDNAHVGGQEVDQTIGTSAGQTIEGITHGLAIGVEAIAHATVASSIAAAANKFLIDLQIREGVKKRKREL